MKHPDQWRDTIDPFTLPYRSFKPLEILGYPHAGNDVFYVRGLYHGRQINAYIKAARQRGADIGNEISILSQLRSPVTPPVVDFCLDGTPFIVTQALPGERLSTIVGENSALESLSYLEEYGAALARIHRLDVQAAHVKDRKFFHVSECSSIARRRTRYWKRWNLRTSRGFFHPQRNLPTRVFAMGISTMRISSGRSIRSAAFWILSLPDMEIRNSISPGQCSGGRDRNSCGPRPSCRRF